MNAYEVRYSTVELRPVWCLMGPNGLFVGEPFNCPEDAERVCDLCNDAYRRGVEVGSTVTNYQRAAGVAGDQLEARVARLEELINNGGYK